MTPSVRSKFQSYQQYENRDIRIMYPTKWQFKEGSVIDFTPPEDSSGVPEFSIMGLIIAPTPINSLERDVVGGYTKSKPPIEDVLEIFKNNLTLIETKDMQVDGVPAQLKKYMYKGQEKSFTLMYVKLTKNDTVYEIQTLTETDKYSRIYDDMIKSLRIK